MRRTRTRAQALRLARRHPLRRLPVLHTRIVETRGDEHRGIALVADIVVGRIGHHARVRVRLTRVAPLFPLGHRERKGRVEHGRDDVDERNLGDDRREEIGPQVCDRAHEQTARATAPRREPCRRRVPLGDEVFGASDEVGESIDLVFEASVFIPLATHFATASYVGDRVYEAAIEQRQPR